jgi:hypothetical protein
MTSAVVTLLIIGAAAGLGVVFSAGSRGRYQYALLAVMVVCIALAGTAVLTGPAASVQHRAIRPCPSDEGETRVKPCVWDARHMGNDLGSSFIVRRDGHVQHTTHVFAHRAIKAWRNK